MNNLKKLKAGFRADAEPRLINIMIAVQADSLSGLCAALRCIESDVASGLESQALGGSSAGKGKGYVLHQQHQIGDGGDAYFATRAV